MELFLILLAFAAGAAAAAAWIWDDDRETQASELPVCVIDPIATHMGGSGISRRLTEAEARAAYYQLTRAAGESERLYRKEAASIQARNRRDLAQARANFLNSLSEEDRGLLAARLKEAADAEARAQAAYDIARLQREKDSLEKTVARLREEQVPQGKRSAGSI